MTTVRVLHLYPLELGLNGDRGNVLALRRRLEWRGLGVEVVEVGYGDALPGEVDLVHVGSGPRAARDDLLPDVLAKSETLHTWCAAGVPLIAIGAGMQLMARRIVDRDGTERTGAGILPISVRDLSSRAVGEVLGQWRGAERLAGFVNHGVVVEITESEPLTLLDRGAGNAGGTESEDRGEGVRVGALIGTHMGGPVLPMNPVVADELLHAALLRHDLVLPEADERVRRVDELARRSRAAIASRLGRAGVEV